jgi:acyl carrier protein
MSDTRLEKTLAAMSATTSKDVTGVTATTRLADLPIDSLDLFAVVEDLEDTTGRSLSDEAFEKMDTVQSLADFFFEPTA